MRWPLLALATGCGPRPLPPPAASEAELVARVEQAKVDEGEALTLEVRAASTEGWAVTPGEVVAEGLTVTPAGQEGPVLAGDYRVTTWRYTLTGPPGSYVVQPGGGLATGPNDARRELETPPLFVDIGVPGPSGGPMADLEAAPPKEPPRALFAAISAAVLLALGAGALWWARRSRTAPPPPLPDPPHVVASRAWERARLAGLDDHALALELSRILRVYLEAITGFPATARTTREILGALEQEGRLGASLRMRAGHVLDATDRLKFAREGGGEAFFQSMDEDFAAVLEATRPAVEPAPEPPGGGRA